MLRNLGKEHIHKHCKYHEKIISNVYDDSYYDYQSKYS